METLYRQIENYLDSREPKPTHFSISECPECGGYRIVIDINEVTMTHVIHNYDDFLKLFKEL